MTADLISILLHVTFASSLALAFVLLLRKPTRGQFGAHVAYSLWLLVPVAIGVALIPAPVAPPDVLSLAAVVPSAFVQAMPPQEQIVAPFDADLWMSCAWITGALVCVILLAIQQRRFMLGLGRLAHSGERVWRAENVTSCPALVGAWQPRIVLPEDFDERYTATERVLILAHERTHIARADAQLNLLASAMRCVFWFNPLFHFAASRFRFDQELACDASVIARFPEARRQYADAMLKTQLADIGLPVGCHWQSSHPLKERISMLKSSLPSPRRKRLGIALSTVFVVTVAAMAWAEQPKRLATPAPNDGDVSTELRIKIDGHNLDGWSLDADGHERAVRSSSDYSEFLMDVPSGHSFKLGFFKGSERWQIDATPEQQPDGTLKLSTDLSHNNAAVSHPVLLSKASEPAGIRIGEEAADGSFKGFEAQVTMASTPGITQASVFNLAQHASYRSITRIEYPAAQAKAGTGGTVFVTAHVAADGHVVSTSLKAGPGSAPDVYPLVTAALAGVQRWTFNPAQRDGQPVPSDEIVPVVFEGPNRHDNKAGVAGALDAITVQVPRATAEATPTDRPPNEDVQFRMSAPPKYPASAIRAHQMGKIVLKVLVSETGEPVSAAVDQATPPEAEAIFADASISAVMRWRFNPGLRDGKPYEGYVLVPVTYSLSDDEDEKSAAPSSVKDDG